MAAQKKIQFHEYLVRVCRIEDPVYGARPIDSIEFGEMG